MHQRTLIIAGMHRSGTSLLSNWLQKCGLDIGHKLLDGNIGNVDGHFEDVDFIRFHEDTLEEHNESHFGWVTHPIEELTGYQTEKLKSIIDFKNKMSSQWGWKDPRTCLFLKHYRELIPGAYYLHIIRDYKSTVSSLISRDFKHHETRYLSRKWPSRFVWKNFRRKKRLLKFNQELADFYLRIWIAYNEELLNNMALVGHDKYLMVDSAKLRSTSRQVYDHLTGQWHFDLKPFDFGKIFRENLMNAPIDIDVFVKDHNLIEQARLLYAKLLEKCIPIKTTDLQTELQ